MKRGDTAPDFTLPDDSGEPRTLSDFLATGPVALFFYPIAS
ncbi:redoxin domain-containing protein, partial [Lentzea sp.]